MQAHVRMPPVVAWLPSWLTSRNRTDTHNCSDPVYSVGVDYVLKMQCKKLCKMHEVEYISIASSLKNCINYSNTQVSLT